MAKSDATSQMAQIPAESTMLIMGLACIYALLCGFIAVAQEFKIYNIPAPKVEDSVIVKLKRSQQFWMRSLFVVGAGVIGTLRIEDTCGRNDETNYCDNWQMMFWYGLVLVATASISTAPFEFYLGEGLGLMDYLSFFLKGKEVKSPEELKEASRQRWADGGSNAEGTVTFATLMPSFFITWIFAKSIRNSAALGGMYGIGGGFGYATWYLSFVTASVCCYLLRVRYNFKSLPSAVYTNYGAVAVVLFQICLTFRLFNEIWSNAGVIGGFYGAKGSPGYWGAAWLSVVIPMVYVIMGGMRASIFSDVMQAALAVLFLVIVLCTIASDVDFSGKTDAFSWKPGTLYTPRMPEGSYYDNGCWVLWIAGSIQGIISYPFFDPVLTDRAFLGTPKVMLKSGLVGGLCAALFIVFYSVIGIYGAFWKETYLAECGCIQAVKGNVTDKCPGDWNPCAHITGSAGEPSAVAVILGYRAFALVETFITFIMITASMSTLDSTFTSASKLFSLEFCGWLNLQGDARSYAGPLMPQDLENIGSIHITIARIVMILLGLFSTAFLGVEGDVMKATTAAGTCVMGIGAPIWFMTVWKTKQGDRRGWRQAPLAFIIPCLVGFFFGLSYWHNGLKNDDGKVNGGWTYDLKLGHDEHSPKGFYYSRFLGTNLYGHIVVIVLFFLFFGIHQVLPSSFEKYFPQVLPLGEREQVVIGSKGAGKEVSEEAPEAKLETEVGREI